MADARSPSDRYRQGMATRRRVLGDAHVDRASSSATPFDQPFQEMITEGAWGTVWSRPGISPRERSMITIALLAALGHDEEVGGLLDLADSRGLEPTNLGIRRATLEDVFLDLTGRALRD